MVSTKGGRMIYKLFTEAPSELHPIEQILQNRKVDDLEKWLNPSEKFFYSPNLLGKDKINAGIEMLSAALANKRKIYVVVDCDVDGFTSAAILLNFLYENYPDNTEYISYGLHSGKQHGLSDMMDNIPDDCLLIVPDAGTNDVEQMLALVVRGCDVLCLDHHEADNYVKDNPNVVIINNQICDYPNKNLSGAGIVWQFLRAYSSEKNIGRPNDYIDLVALGVLSDMMDYRSLETRAVIDAGLKNITNPFFYSMTIKNEFSIDKMGGINYMSIAFYVTPFINAVIRSGTADEKELVFKSMLQQYAFERIPSGKRGHKGEEVPLVEEAVRIAANVKNRQTKLQDETMALLESRIQEQHLLDNGIIILCCEPGEVEKNLAGLVANKIQAKYQHPCYVLTKSKNQDDKEYFWRGSGRNYSMSENQDLRQLALDTELPEYVMGR